MFANKISTTQVASSMYDIPDLYLQGEDMVCKFINHKWSGKLHKAFKYSKTVPKTHWRDALNKNWSDKSKYFRPKFKLDETLYINNHHMIYREINLQTRRQSNNKINHWNVQLWFIYIGTQIAYFYISYCSDMVGYILPTSFFF